MEELIEAFDPKGLNKSPAIFNMEKLVWFNAEYIRKLGAADYLELVKPWFDQALADKNIDYDRLAELMQGRTEVFNRVPDMVRFLNQMPEYDLDLYNNKKQKSTLESSLDSLQFILPILKKIDTWQETDIHDAVMEAIKTAERKNGTVMWPLRIAISGLLSTPGGAIEIAYLLGKDECISRVENAIVRLSQ
ncbi:MAG: hypothetical protein GX858_05655 [Clostridiales bacterium]|nr:hypothetical protein [Clostridiales bacterium]